MDSRQVSLNSTKTSFKTIDKKPTVNDAKFNTSNFTPTTPLNSKPVKGYTYSTGKGNFPNHIEKALTARGNWKKIDEELAIDTANFLWQQLNLNFKGYDKLDERLEAIPNEPFFLNHFEVTRGICTKTGLIRTLQAYYNENEAAKNSNYSVFDTTPWVDNWTTPAIQNLDCFKILSSFLNFPYLVATLRKSHSL